MSKKNWTAGPWKSAGSLVYFANNGGGLCVKDTPDPQSNANLIAAAPDLYEALEKLAMDAYNACADSSCNESLSIAENALAKARGEK